MEKDYEQYKVSAPKFISGRPLNFKHDLPFLTAGVATTLIMAILFGSLAGFVTLVGVVTALKPLRYGRVYYVFGEQFGMWWIGWHQKGRRWEKSDAQFAVDTAHHHRQPHLPFAINVLESPETELLTLVHNERTKTDAIIVNGTGNNLPGSDLSTGYAFLHRLGRVSKKVAATASGLSVGQSYVFRRRPQNIPQMAMDMSSNWRRDVVLPSVLENEVPDEQWTDHDRRMVNLHTVATELLDIASEVTGEISMTTVLTVQRQGLLANRKALSSRDAKRLPVVKLAKTAVQELEAAGVTDVSVMSEREVNSHLRGAWDIADIEDHYLRELDPNGDRDEWWPQRRIHVFNDHLVIDDTYSAVVMFQSHPAERCLPPAVQQLLGVDANWFSLAVVGEIIKVDKPFGEYRSLDIAIPLRDAINVGGRIVHKGTRKRRKEQALWERQELIEDAGFTQAYVILMAVSELSLDALEDTVDRVISHGQVVNMTPKRVTGETRQEKAFWSATTGLPLL